ncbi:hypothetical protein FB45DRAFT_1061888 [Roridomyces roridus]|uniref:Extracellular membrane protein CFEM domain-containing protein n=1 Tax=Roridomyces roridus TaxID=1738132 RepID=A0AAD7FGB9_9AGAR|nr:hypothetical protein FB45DRAFT_1061888 [Roridomyces roridus]
MPAIVSEVPENCAPLNNPSGNGPCTLLSFCGFDKSCICTAVEYFLSTACATCNDLLPTRWSNYSTLEGCGVAPLSILPSPLPQGNLTLPSWAIAMASATPSPVTLDFQAAVTLARTTTATGSAASSSLSPGSTGSSTISLGSTVSLRPSSSQISVDGAHKQAISTGAMAGIAVGAIGIFSAAIVLFLLFRYRRRRRGSNREYTAVDVARPYPVFHSTVAGTTSSTNESRDEPRVQANSKARQEYLHSELQATTEKLTHLRDQRRFPMASRLGSHIVPSATSGTLASVSRMQEQLAAQEAQIRELHAQLSSPGLSDEPPPGYSEGSPTEV